MVRDTSKLKGSAMRRLSNILAALSVVAMIASGGGAYAQGVTTNQTFPINISTATDTQIVAAPGAGAVHVTSYLVLAGGTGNVTLEYGTGTNCATGKTALSGAIPLTAQVGVAMGDGTGTIVYVPPKQALCILTSANVQISGHLSASVF